MAPKISAYGLKFQEHAQCALCRLSYTGKGQESDKSNERNEE